MPQRRLLVFTSRFHTLSESAETTWDPFSLHICKRKRCLSCQDHFKIIFPHPTLFCLTRTSLTFYTFFLSLPGIFYLSLLTGYFSANYRHVYLIFKNTFLPPCVPVVAMDPFTLSFISELLRKKHTPAFTAATSFPSCGSLTPSGVAGSGLSLHCLVSHVSLKALCGILASQLSELVHCW